MIRSGYGREVVNRIQRERKERGYSVTDRIRVTYYAQGELAQAIDEHREYIMGETLSLQMEAATSPQSVEAEVDSQTLSFQLAQAQ